VLACLGLQVAAVYVPPLQAALRTVPLTATDWGIVATSSLAPLGLVELVKFGQSVNVRAVGDRSPFE
jgi:hypothetical protein